MSVGKNHHSAIQDIVPSHFMESANLSGVSTPAMKAIFEDIAANAEEQAETAIAALPNGFPDQLVTSTMAAMPPCPAHRRYAFASASCLKQEIIRIAIQA